MSIPFANLQMRGKCSFTRAFGCCCRKYFASATWHLIRGKKGRQRSGRGGEREEGRGKRGKGEEWVGESILYHFQ